MLHQPLSEVIRTTSYHIKKLASMGLKTVEDLLWYLPRTYEDRSHFTSIPEMNTKAVNVVKGTVCNIQKMRAKSGKRFVRATLLDADNNEAQLLWFNQLHVTNMLRENEEIIISGKAKYERGSFTLMNPSFEKSSQHTSIHTGRIIPIYPESDKITSDWMRNKIKGLLAFAKDIKDPLPEEVRAEKELLPLSKALKEIHFPTDNTTLEKAKERIAFDELLLLQCSTLQKKLLYQHNAERSTRGIGINSTIIKEFLETLPFSLTDGQKISLYEILKDMEKNVPMMRLLQGDVGSGKTVVAIAALLHTMRHGYQTAFMVPTEILAIQHYEKLVTMLSKFGLRAELLTGSITGAKKQKIVQGLQTGTVDCVIGTHALIQEHIGFHNLKLIVIDEQHRFGVEQRKNLASHGYPHILHMTATPIPRTLALTIYGDQDVSVISEMPKGRKPIITRVIPPRERRKMYQFIENFVQKGRQIFVICPLVEDSDKLQVKSAETEFELLANDIFPNLRVALLHGRMHPGEKDRIMQQFKEHKYDILVSTSVIEVGIDIPNANIILIEGAERFGLSQLHQFRGRVGRGEHQSYCLLATTKTEQSRSTKLRAMEKYTDGFKLSQIDLQLRGPGEVYGFKQSGLADLKMADLADARMVSNARNTALALLEEDHTLGKWPLLQQKVQKRLHTIIIQS